MCVYVFAFVCVYICVNVFVFVCECVCMRVYVVFVGHESRGCQTEHCCCGTKQQTRSGKRAKLYACTMPTYGPV